MTTPTYASATTRSRPNQLVSDALVLIGGGTRALDVGAGSLCDTRLLLESGLHVDAVDIDRFSLSCAGQLNHPKLRAFCCDIRDLALERKAYHLIVAIHVLPFIPKDQLASVCAKLVASLDGNGAICATFFGMRDEWAQRHSQLSFVTSDEVAHLFSQLSPLSFEDREYAGRDVHGNAKHWHVIRGIFQNSA